MFAFSHHICYSLVTILINNIFYEKYYLIIVSTIFSQGESDGLNE